MTIVKEIDDVKVHISSDIEYLKSQQQHGKPVVLILNDDNFHEDTSFTRYAVMLDDDNNIDDEYLRMVVARYLKKPLLIGKGDSVSVREFTNGDGEFIRKLYDNSAHPFLEGLFSEEDDAEEMINNYIAQVYDYYGYGIWAVCLDNELIGIAGVVQRETDNEKPDLELGYFIDERFQKRGYAFEACKIIQDYAERNIYFNKIFVHVNSQNISSIKLAEKLGVDIIY